jgi:hypothetical protein
MITLDLGDILMVCKRDAKDEVLFEILNNDEFQLVIRNTPFSLADVVLKKGRIFPLEGGEIPVPSRPQKS